MKKLLLILPFLALGGCASAGSFTGAVVREVVRGPDYYGPRPYYYRPIYRPYWHHRGWQYRGW